MRKHLVSVVVGGLMVAVGLVLYFVFFDVETSVVGLRQLGLVLAVVGGVEILVSGIALLRPSTRRP
jgi:hypothetical protein